MIALLDEGYRRCAGLTRQYGTTYYWGAVLLTPAQRRDVYAVYALCRLADDIVDEPAQQGSWTPAGRRGGRWDVSPDAGQPADTPLERLDAFVASFRAALAHGTPSDPVMAAIVETIRRRDIPLDCFDRFFAAMALDLTRTTWASWPELRDGYMEGSAAVIGEMMLPVLEPSSPQAKEPARQLGLAFQLTNFIRDVGEDLDRGRVYLPQDDLARHGADPWERHVTSAWRCFLAEQIRRNRELYRAAEAGVPLLPPASARCVSTALVLYERILDRVEEADYDVFTVRRRVPTWEKAALAGKAMMTGQVPATSSGDVGGDMGKGRIPLARLPQPPERRLSGTWRQARPARIRAALEQAQATDPGGWYVAGESREVSSRAARVRVIAGTEVALWRTPSGELRAGPGSCPHLGARLDGSVVDAENIRCRWHGMALPAEGGAAWRCLPAYDDGVLAWVRLATAGESATDAPRQGPRPDLATALTAVIASPGTCEPRDVIANRLDPWHGAWLHPYAFSHLTVDEDASSPERLVLDVAYRLGRTWAVPVRAEFTCPDARTITMEITSGEGRGSVVETHATPLGAGPDGRPRTMVVEATIATSPRPGFQLARRLAPAVRPFVRRAAQQLWVDDIAYAERTWQLRQRR